MDWQPPQKWVFKQELEKLFDTDICYGNAPKSFQSQFEKIIGLWKSYVGTAVRALFKANNYDVVYAWHAVIGLVFAASCRLFRLRKIKIVVAQLIVPSREDSIAQRLKLAFTRYALARVELVLVYSSIEVELFQNAYENGFTQFVFTPLGIELPNAHGMENKGYIFSGGRSNRDYDTLIKAAAELNVHVQIAAQRFNIRTSTLPKNVSVHYDAFGDDFLRLLRQSMFVVIPLDRVDESSGQLVLLQAMALGKAIIITENRGISDYYQPDVTALVAPPHDVGGLKRQISRLMNEKQRRDQIGLAAQKFVQQFSLQKQAQRVAALIVEKVN